MILPKLSVTIRFNERDDDNPTFSSIGPPPEM